MKIFFTGLFIWLFILLPLPSAAFEYQDGDIIFASMDCKICTTIKETSHSHFSHIGIVIIENDKPYVIEAYNGVEKVSLQKFLEKRTMKDNHYQYAVGRIQDVKTAKKAARYAQTLIGKPFDNSLIWGEEKIYCSELIYFAYKHASPEKDIFSPRPMNFTIRQEIWSKHFEGDMPQGRPGMFPQDFFKNKQLNIMYNYFDSQK